MFSLLDYGSLFIYGKFEKNDMRKYSKQIAYYIHYFPLQLWTRNFNLHKHRVIKHEPLNINLSAHEYTNIFLSYTKYTNNNRLKISLNIENTLRATNYEIEPLFNECNYQKKIIKKKG